MTVAGQAFANCSTSLFQAKNEGYIEDVLTSPLRPWQVAASYLSGGLLRGVLAAVIVAAASLPFAHEEAQPALAALALPLTAVVFASLGVITGIWAETLRPARLRRQHRHHPARSRRRGLYSARALGEPWATLTRLDPLYYLVDAGIARTPAAQQRHTH